jgi:hypothetical protein
VAQLQLQLQLQEQEQEQLQLQLQSQLQLQLQLPSGCANNFSRVIITTFKKICQDGMFRYLNVIFVHIFLHLIKMS